MAGRPAPNFNWEKVGKGSAATVPVGAVMYFLYQLFTGSIDEIHGDLDKKADVVSVEALASNVEEYGKDIDDLRKEQIQQGKSLKEIETRQEEVIKGQERILDAIEDKKDDRNR